MLRISCALSNGGTEILNVRVVEVVVIMVGVTDWWEEMELRGREDKI